MDKYEFNIKVEQIKKLIGKGDHETAMKIADTIDWRRVRSTGLLSMVAQVYEQNKEYQEAKDILLLAFERAPLGRGLLFKLADLALREGNVSEAEAYYREFCNLAADDPRQNLLRYLILEAKGAALEQQIHSLERYCQEELDEKWMYHLAELYRENGNEDECVKMCDKIMLLFGLGKYVDRAMELKLQYAPLTKYQMDLVDNREKYEEKLRAVEQRFDKRMYRSAEEDYDDSDQEEADLEEQERVSFGMDSDRNSFEESEFSGIRGRLSEETAVKLQEAAAEENLAKEMSRIEPYDEEEDDSKLGGTRVLESIQDIKKMREAARRKSAELAAAESAAAKEETEKSAEEPISVKRSDEAELEDIEDWDLEPEEESGNHLMIEAEDAQRGLELAIESLKKIHRELGTKASAAKISGEKLNKKGIFAVEDRLAGKDLIIERAGDLDRLTIHELDELMERDQTGIIVVLIDTPMRLERFHQAHPELAGRFQYIGCDSSWNGQREDRNSKNREQVYDPETARKLLAEREEEIRRQAAKDAEDMKRRQAEKEAEEIRRRQAVREAEEAKRIEEERILREQEEADKKARYEEEERLRARYEEEERLARYREKSLAEAQAQENSYEAPVYKECSREKDTYESDFSRKEPYFEEESCGASSYGEKNGEEPDYEEEREAAALETAASRFEEDEQTEAQNTGKKTMDVEEFAQYACKYASDIDCSISGKSMLALYERAEIMEEDGIALTKEAAEDLIEEAADKAEKRSFGGIFSSQYDKEGRLILKEKHFFN